MKKSPRCKLWDKKGSPLMLCVWKKSSALTANKLGWKCSQKSDTSRAWKGLCVQIFAATLTAPHICRLYVTTKGRVVKNIQSTIKRMKEEWIKRVNAVTYKKLNWLNHIRTTRSWNFYRKQNLLQCRCLQHFYDFFIEGKLTICGLEKFKYFSNMARF